MHIKIGILIANIMFIVYNLVDIYDYDITRNAPFFKTN